MSFNTTRFHQDSIEGKDVRLVIMAFVFFLMGLILIFRLFDLQILRNDSYLEAAERAHSIERRITPVRGEIYLKDGNELTAVVSNRDYYLVYAVPAEIIDRQGFVDAVAPALGMTEPEWKEMLSKISKPGDPYEPIKRKVDSATVEKLKTAGVIGLYFEPESYRFYPEKNLGSHVLGFVDYDGVGQYGLEGYYNQQLFGEYGILRSATDASGLPIAVGDREVKQASHGASVVLTLDKSIQIKACAEIQRGVEEFLARQGTVIVMEPSSGKIIAMCSFPQFDSENYSQAEDVRIFNNPAIFKAYEPGSIFKVLTMAIGLDTKKITPQTTYEDTGEVKIIGLKPIKNSDLKAHGIQTMTQALEKSLNTGAVHVVQLIGKDVFRKYLENFGFGKSTGIELDTEVAGNISSLSKRGEVYTFTASFGQGITATSLQFLSAFSSLINGGKLMKPYLVERIINSDESVSVVEPTVVRQVVTPNTSALITGMMVSVVENGYSLKSKIAGYYVGGKTGTAQVAGPDGKYGDETTHTFVGFAPAFDPRFAMIVEMDNPTKYNFSSETATIVFRRIAEHILQIYNIAPERDL